MEGFRVDIKLELLELVRQLYIEYLSLLEVPEDMRLKGTVGYDFDDSCYFAELDESLRLQIFLKEEYNETYYLGVRCFEISKDSRSYNYTGNVVTSGEILMSGPGIIMGTIKDIFSEDECEELELLN